MRRRPNETDEELELRKEAARREMLRQALRTWTPAGLGATLTDEEKERLTKREEVQAAETT